MEKTSLILADDHAILRYGLRSYLARKEDIEVVGEASTGEECIRLFDEKSPDVCIIDIEMPHKNGIEVVRAIRKKSKKAKLMILSMHTDKETIQKAFEAGSNGYLLKDTPKNKIVQAIRAVLRGEKIGNDYLTESTSHSASTPKDTTDSDKITDRELEILQLVVEGYSSPQIAEKLFISRRTVDTHRNNMMSKLQLKNTASLVRYALQNNLVDISSPKASF